MQLPLRIGLITLACRDVERTARLFRRLGWPETPESDEDHRTFQCTNGVVIGLSFEETTRVYETLRGVDDVELPEGPTEAPWPSLPLSRTPGYRHGVIERGSVS